MRCLYQLINLVRAYDFIVVLVAHTRRALKTLIAPRSSNRAAGPGRRR